MNDADIEKKSDAYHHGDLRGALLRAAEEELAERGQEKFSLRGCARRAGVSHAAPAHHFKDTNALLQALAASGFERLTQAMKAEQAEAKGDGRALLIAAGIGYIRFAVENPQLFQLMFARRSSALADKDLVRHGEAAFSVLVNTIAKLRGPDALKAEAGWIDVTAAWSLVHGYADLAISGRAAFLSVRSFDEQRSAIEAMLAKIAQ